MLMPASCGVQVREKPRCVRMHRLDLADGHFVIAPNLDLRAQFAQVLDEVVSNES